MDQVMLVESLGFNVMFVSMVCDLDIVVVFGKYHCVVIMEADNSKVVEGFRRGDLYIVGFSTEPQPTICLLAKALGEETCILLISLQDHNLLLAYLQKLQKAGYGIDDLVMLA